MSTRWRPVSSACWAATAMLLNRQNPMARSRVAGWAVGAHPERRLAAQEQIDELDRAARGVQRGLVRARAGHSVEIELPASARRHRLDAVDVGRRVDGLEHAAVDRLGAAALEPEPTSGLELAQ